MDSVKLKICHHNESGKLTMHNSKGQTSRESPVVKTNKKLFFAADKMSSISGASNDIYQYREAEQKYNQSNGISQDAYSI